MDESAYRYETLWPLGRSTQRSQRANEGLGDLDGKKIALVWDHLFKGDEILDQLRERVGSRYDGVEFLDHSQFVSDFADDYSVFDKLRLQLAESGADAAVVAVGACGRCTAGVMRATAVAGDADLPAVAVVSSGFEAMARSIASVYGDADPRLAVYPGAIQTDTQADFDEKVRAVVLDQIEQGLLMTKAAADDSTGAARREPTPNEIVFTGTLDEVEEHFIAEGWSDGLPVVPPTPARVDRFLEAVGEDPETVLGILPPELRELSIRSIAVNAVMAGCAPEYMPVLVAACRCLMDPRFRLEDLTSTFGLEPLIVVSGPVVTDLDFNYGTGAMRLGRRANSSIGRCLRLILRNVGGLRIPPGANDAGAIGYSFNVAMAEDESSTLDIGWNPFRVDNGFPIEESTVSVLLVTNHSAPIYTAGDSPEAHLDTIARILGNAIGPWAYTSTVHGGFNPLIFMSPNVARALSDFGYDKDAIRRYLADHLSIPAGITEGYARQVGRTDFSFASTIEDPEWRKTWVASDDENRLVPMLMNPDWTSIVIGGNPGRNQSRAYIGNLSAGLPITHVIERSRSTHQ